MNKKELMSAVANVLRENKIRKSVKTKSEVFRVIQDGSGDEAVFTIDRADRKILYSIEDVQNIIDATIAVVLDCIRRGEPVSVRGFGSLSTIRVAPRRSKDPIAGNWYDVPSFVRPKFKPGFALITAARSAGLQEEDVGAEQFLPPPDEEEE